MSGGWSNRLLLMSVETYDYYENKWTYLPDMIEERSLHAAVSMANKMFVIGRSYTTTCDIFDSYSGNFTYIKTMNLPTKFVSPYRAVCIGQNIVVLSTKRTKQFGTKLIIYDVNSNQWSEKEWSFLKNLIDFSCVKYYE